jgi:hypothetical protein
MLAGAGDFLGAFRADEITRGNDKTTFAIDCTNSLYLRLDAIPTLGMCLSQLTNYN